MISFKQYLSESIPAIAAAAALSANVRRRNQTKQGSTKPTAMTPYKQGKADKAAGNPYNNPHPFDPKSGADVNYDHNSYKAGYHE